eukprot:13882-Heterococcus_DN1.PRE.4
MHSALESPRGRLKHRSESCLGLTLRTRLLLSAPLFAAFFLLGNFISALGEWLDLLRSAVQKHKEACAAHQHYSGQPCHILALVSLPCTLAARSFPVVNKLYCHAHHAAPDSPAGPSIPAFARAVHRPETDFGGVFAARGSGYLLGSFLAGYKLCGNASYAGVVALTFAQGFCGGSIDAPANVAIVKIHGDHVGPWMQTLHFCFSVGALVSPFVVAQTGYRMTYVAFALLSVPAAIATIWMGVQPLAKSLDVEDSAVVSSMSSMSSFDASASLSYKAAATQDATEQTEQSITKRDIEVEMRSNAICCTVHGCALISATVHHCIADCDTIDQRWLSYCCLYVAS